jgi:glycosyltransferase involved in cell wall biosynthesis
MSKSKQSLAALRLWALSHPTTSVLLKRLGRSKNPATADQVDLVFVTPPLSAPGWILEAICREIGSRLPGLDIRYCHHGEELPPAGRYFFSHYMFYVASLSKFRTVRRGQSFVFATHLEPEKHGIPNEKLARLLDSSDGVICMNEALRAELQRMGVAPRRLGVAVGAASSEVYRRHTRVPDGKVGFCSAYYARKSPDLVLQIVKKLPHRQFILLGKGWRDYPHFHELLEQPNFTYVEAPYSEYAGYYAQMSVFVSASQLEGGPIPLLEAMMSNAVPVASRTGFAPDVITHGRNGFIFDLPADAGEVCTLIEKAYALDADVVATVTDCDWVPYAARIAALMGMPAVVQQGPSGTA